MKEIAKTIIVIFWTKWRTFLNEVSEKSTFYSVIKIILFLFLFFFCWSIAFSFQELNQFSIMEIEKKKELIHIYCFFIFGILCFLYLSMKNKEFEIFEFLSIQPLSIKILYFTFFVSEIFSGWMLVLAPFFVSIFITYLPEANFLYYLLSTFLFLSSSIFLIRFLISIFQYLSSSFFTARKITISLLFFGIVISYYVISVWKIENIDDIFTLISLNTSIDYSKFLTLFPSWIYSEIIFLLSEQHPISELWKPFLCFFIYALIFSWSGYVLYVHNQERKSSPEKTRWGTDIFDLAGSGTVWDYKKAFFIKEIIYLFRIRRIKIIIIVDWLIIFFISLAEKLNNREAFFLLFLLFSMMQISLTNNMLGMVKDGILNDFILPLRSNRILFGRNMALFFLFSIMFFPGFLWFIYVRWDEIRLLDLFLSIILYLFSFFFYITTGNLISILFPQPASFDKMFPGLSKGAYFPGWIVSVTPPLLFGVLYYLSNYLLKKPSFLYIGAILLFFSSVFLYVVSLPKMGNMMEEGKEDLIEMG